MSRLKKSFAQPLIYFISKTFCYLVFKLFWRLKVYGEENFPKSGAVIVAANHRSLVDPPLVGVSMRRSIHFLAKEELFRFRPFAWFINNLNAYPLRRGGSDVRAFKLAQEILSAGEALALFPEGRRGKTDDLQPAKAGVGMLSALVNCPIVPVYISNSAYMSQFRPISVFFGAPLYPKDFTSHQAMADAVMGEIYRLKTGLALTKI